MDYVESLHIRCQDSHVGEIQARCPWLSERGARDGVVVLSTPFQPVGYWTEDYTALLDTLRLDGLTYGWGRQRHAIGPGIVVMPKPDIHNLPPGMTVVSRSATFRVG